MGLTLPLLVLICGIPEVVKGVWAPFPFLLGLQAPLGGSEAENSLRGGISHRRQGSAWSAHLSAHWSTPACFVGDGLVLAPPCPVSLGAISQSCLLPMIKIHSFPSKNTNHFLASQRTALVKWAMVSG